MSSEGTSPGPENVLHCNASRRLSLERDSVRELIAAGNFFWLDLHAPERHPNRQRLVLAHDRRAFSRDPDAGDAGGIVGIASVLPLPPETIDFGRVGALGAAIQRLYTAPVLGPDAIKFGQGRAARRCLSARRAVGVRHRRSPHRGA